MPKSLPAAGRQMPNEFQHDLMPKYFIFILSLGFHLNFEL
jgi:hypothetical protein